MTTSRVDASLRRAVARAGVDAIVAPRALRAPTSDPSPGLRDVADLGDDVLLLLFDVAGVTALAPVIEDDGELRRARPGDGAFEALVRIVRDRRAVGAVSPRPTRAVPHASGERGIDVDQTNVSVVVGEQLVVKLFPEPGPGPQPGEDLPAHLAAVGFEGIPEPFGSVRWDTGGDDLLVATVTRFLPGARDGWTWFLELALHGVGDGTFAPGIDAAERCGGLVARFHAALATPSSVLRRPVSRVGADEVGGWRRRALSVLEEALAVTSGDEGARLAELEPLVRREIAAFEGIRATPVQPIHGDLHVGQILRWEGGHAITDLDGSPLAAPEDRLAREPAARDVASFVRSLDHLARIAQRRLGAPARDADAWSRTIRRCFLDAYVSALEQEGAGALYDDRLHRPFEVAQACHEYVYAARFLPRWLPVADLALPALLEDAAT